MVERGWTKEHAARLGTLGFALTLTRDDWDAAKAALAEIARQAGEIARLRGERDALQSTTDRLKASTASAHARFHKANAKAAYAVAEADKLRSRLKAQGSVFHELKRSLYYARRETDELRALSAAPSREQEHGSEEFRPSASPGADDSAAPLERTTTAPSPGAEDAQARRFSPAAGGARWLPYESSEPEWKLCSRCARGVHRLETAKHERTCWPRAEPERGALKGLLTPPETGQDIAAPTDAAGYERGYQDGWNAARAALR